MPPSQTGAHTRLAYDYQSDFQTAASTIGLPFGSNATMDTLEGSHQAARVFQPDSREAAQIIEQLFDGSFSVSFDLTNGWWLRSVISDADSASPSGSGPYTYSFNDHAGGNTPASQYPNPITIARVGTASSYTGNPERLLSRCVVTTADVSVSVNGNVTVTLSGAYGDDEKQSVSVLSSQPAIDERTMTFAQGELITDQDGSPTTVNRVQDLTLSIENSVDMVGEIGTRIPVSFSPKARNPSATYSKLAQGDTELDRFYGDASSVQSTIENGYVLRARFDNGKGGTDENSLEFDLAGSFPDGYTESGVGDPQANFQNELNEMNTTVTANYTTNESSASWQN